MNDFTLTTQPPGGRGCGSRAKGGIYGSLGTSPDGVPVWEYLIDPPLPYSGDKFQGIITAPKEITEQLPDNILLLLDMVGMESYPSYASVVEEIARFGLSRRFPKNFDFSMTKGKRVMLGLLHWRGIPAWGPNEYLDPHEALPNLIFKYCKEMPDDYASIHYPDCIYWGWPLAWRHHKDNAHGKITTPWGSFDPLRVARFGPDWTRVWTPEEVSERMPDADYAPGLFGVFPLSHFESVGYVPDGTNVEDSDLPVVVMEE